MQQIKYILIILALILVPTFAHADPVATGSNGDETGPIVPIGVGSNGPEYDVIPTSTGSNGDEGSVIPVSSGSNGSESRSLGLAYPCFYIRVYYTGDCVNSPTLIRTFQTNQLFKNDVIYKWRLKIFGY